MLGSHDTTIFNLDNVEFADDVEEENRYRRDFCYRSIVSLQSTILPSGTALYPGSKEPS